jgi:hypothetical protein
MRSFAVLLLIVALVACHEKPQPAETDTTGNATDRAANGTSGTGEPGAVSTDTRSAAESLGTVAPSAASTAPVAITGTAEVHAGQTATTSTISGPGTTTAAVATPTETTATVKTSTGATVQKKKQ